MPPLLAVKLALVPPFASLSVPVRFNVALDPLVVNPVVPPDIVTAPAEGVTDPASPLIVVMAPSAVMFCHEGGAPLFAVKTNPAVPLFARSAGIPVAPVMRTPLLRVDSPETTLAELEYRIWLIVVVAGQVEVDQEGLVDAPDCNIWFAVVVPLRMAPAEALE
jgi:hypothetical protein